MVIKSSNKNTKEDAKVHSIPENKDSRIISEKNIDSNEDSVEYSLRPKRLSEFIGQESIKNHLWVAIKSAQIRQTPVEHILFYGPPWLWKTTLSNIIARESEALFKQTSWPAIEKQSDLVSLLTGLEEWSLLFIDEIHRIRPQIEEILYGAMEDKTVDIMVGTWAGATSVIMKIAPFTLVGATTKLSKLTWPLRDRFGHICKLELYNNKELEFIIARSADILNIELDKKEIEEVAKRSRWTPRIANRLTKIIRDYILVHWSTKEAWWVITIFNNVWIDEVWLDNLDRKLLQDLNTKFAWWPVWINTLSAILWEEASTIEEVVEPYLLKIWFIERTPRWRKITRLWESYILWM